MIIGIDLGGSKIAGVLTTHTGKILMETKIPTEASQGKKHVFNNIKKTIQVLTHSEKSKIEAIGIGAPGPIIYEKGIVVEAPNLPGWKKVPLKQIFEKEYKVPILVENDANCAALAEARFGAGKFAKNFIYITVSTGIGGGIIIDRKIYHGAIGCAGEIGHMKIDLNGPKCGCGKHGCIEAISRQIRKKTGMNSMALELAAKHGNKTAINAINELAFYLGVGISNLVNILNPELVVIGGGLSNMKNLLFVPLRKEFKKQVLALPGRSVKIVRAKLGTQAGVLGAAALCM
jgi:glucokinase